MTDAKQVQTNVRLDEDVLDWFKAQASAQDRTLAWTINHALVMYRKKLERDREARRARKRQR